MACLALRGILRAEGEERRAGGTTFISPGRCQLQVSLFPLFLHRSSQWLLWEVCVPWQGANMHLTLQEAASDGADHTSEEPSG